MFTRIMVPLDGSVQSEKALFTAVRMAIGLEASLLLLHIIEPHHKETDAGQSFSAAESYLKTVRDIITDPAITLSLKPEKVDTLTLIGHPVAKIIEAVPLTSSNLVVMTTHGRNGLSRLVLGSVSGKVLEKSKVPVILVRPGKNTDRLPQILEKPTAPFFNGRLVVTLDGTTVAEEALTPAIELALQSGSVLSLLRVEPPEEHLDYNALVSYYGTLYGSILADESKKQQQQPFLYLTELQKKLAETNVKCDKVLRKGDPVNVIPHYCHEINAPLIIMATPARNAFERFMLGSVSWDLVQKADLPIMLVYSNKPNTTELSNTANIVFHL